MSEVDTHAAAREYGRQGGRKSWAGTTPEQRRQRTLPARAEAAIKLLVDEAPPLTDEQRERLRSYLAPAAERAANTGNAPEAGGKS